METGRTRAENERLRSYAGRRIECRMISRAESGADHLGYKQPQIHSRVAARKHLLTSSWRSGRKQIDYGTRNLWDYATTRPLDTS